MGVRELVGVLESLRAGERAWFWFCRAAEETPLVLSPLVSDPTMSDLARAVAAVSRLEASVEHTGLCVAGESGILRFYSPTIGADALSRLSEWAGGELGRHPELARLKGATMIRVNREGEVETVFAQDSHWSAFPDPIVPGSERAMVGRLRDLKPGERAWIWMAVGSGAGLVVRERSGDADGGAFREAIGMYMRRFGPPLGAFRGVWHHVSATERRITVLSNVSEAGEILEAFVERRPEDREVFAHVEIVLDGGDGTPHRVG